MLSAKTTYTHDLEAVKETITSKRLWPAVLSKYPQYSEALASPGQHVTCPFHGGEDDFRLFDDALTSDPKSKHAAICTCGNFSHIDLVLQAEGKTAVDMEVVNMLADIAGMDAVKPLKPLAKEKAGGGGSKYPAFALSQSRPVDGVALRYLQNRGLSAIAENLPDAIRCLSDAEYQTGGETVFKGDCLVAKCSYPDGDLAGIIRIFLSPEGGKADIRDSNGKAVDPKPMAGQKNGRQKPLKSSAVRMPGQGSIEHVGEGIETMLSVKSVLPESVAACGTAALLSGFEPSPETKAVIVWSDKDKSGTGQKHASKLLDKLREQGIPAVMAVPPYVLEDGAKGVDWLDVFNRKDGAEVIKTVYTEARETLSAMAEEMVTDKKKTSDLPKRSYQQTIEQPYQALGYDRENVYLMTKVNRQVRAISYKSLSNKALILSIADYEYWTKRYPKFDRNDELTGPDWNLCVNQVIQQSNEAGVYDPAVIRGRGFNLDDGRLVRHLGDRLIVDGQTIDLYAFDSEFTYEQTTRLTVGAYEPLTKEEVLKIETACSLPFWKGKADPFLFLGWCVLSPFCGALKWRPHLWITAPAGTGKSTWLLPLVETIAGKANLAKFDNVSTEAGIRQTLRHDARPVLLEEAEAETPKEKRRLESIIQYARNCSTSNDIQTAKGTPGGTALTFSGSSMFSYISTKDALSFSADKSRTACVELYKVESAERIDEHAKKLTDLKLEFDKQNLSERLITLLSANWQMLQTNIKVFSLEAGKQLRSPRHGDQYGTLLAGYWTVTKQCEVTEEEARTLICSIDLNSMTEDQDEQTDEQRCLDLIMAIDIRVDVYKSVSMTTREAVNALAGEDDGLLRAVASGCDVNINYGQLNAEDAKEEKIRQEEAEGRTVLKRVLRRHGIIYQAHNEQLHGCKGRGIYIANNCEYLKRQMDKTPFVNWSKILKRLDKAEPSKGTVKFDGNSVRSVFVTF